MSRNAVTMCNKKEPIGLFFIARSAATIFVGEHSNYFIKEGSPKGLPFLLLK